MESVLAAVGAGLLSFFSPCILPLLPVYAGVLTTDAGSEKLGLARRCANTIAFVLGICCVFVSLGAGAGAVGSVFDNAYLAMALGILVVVFGLHLAGIVRIPLLSREKRVDLGKIEVKGVAGSFLLGLAFSFGWTPCVGPVLGSILAVAAQGASALAGAGLLLAYSLGLCIPFAVITLAASFALSRLRALHKHLPLIQRIGGILIAVMGLWLVATQAATIYTQHQAAEEAKLLAQAQGTVAGDAQTEGISSAWKNVVLTDLDGNQHRLAECKGKPLYFEFWGSWCTSCVADLGQLTEVYEQHAQADDVQVASVVTPGFFGEKDVEGFTAWAHEQGVSFPVYMDTKGSLFTYLNVSAFPTSVFVNSDGSIARIRVGSIERDELESLLAELS